MKKLGDALRSVRILSVCLLVGAFGTVSAQEADVPLNDGALWQASSQVEKTAYLVGAANFLEVEYVVQQQSDNKATDDQSAIRRWWDALKDDSLDDLINAVDAFYRDNPDQMTVPVLVVIWNTFVETE